MTMKQDKCTGLIDYIVYNLPDCLGYGNTNRCVSFQLRLHETRLDQLREAESPSKLTLSVHDRSKVHPVRKHVLTRSQRIAKRSFDIALALCIIVVLFPLFILIALAIKVDSPGPFVFRQRRVGQFERHFTMYKFRSMYVNSENILLRSHIRTFLKQPDDPRITKVGKILRRTSLDELPQFFNVLLGDMSIVGPRPEVVWISEQHEPWERERTYVPQGITGWWQVTGRASNPLQINAEFDLYYIRNYSLWLDLRILLMTLGCVIIGKGAV